MRKLALRPRKENPQGIPTWHDAVRFQLALDGIVADIPLGRSGVWTGLARKLQIAQEEAGWPEQVNIEVVIELEDGEASLLWKELQKLTSRQLGRNMMTGQPQAPDTATLGEMLEDWEEQLR